MIRFRGNLLKTQDGKLAFLDFGMMADIDEDDRYGLFGLVIGLQNKDLPLVTENLLKVAYSTAAVPVHPWKQSLIADFFTARISERFHSVGSTGSSAPGCAPECYWGHGQSLGCELRPPPSRAR